MAQLIWDVTDNIGVITLNRPEARNALSAEMLDGLARATGEFERDRNVRCVVIRANGPHFLAGGDIKNFHRALTEDREAHLAGFEQRIVRGHQIFYNLRRMPKPVLVSVQGAVAGAGLSLMLAGDLAIGSDDAFFTLAYRHIGLSVDGCASYTLPRIVGERKALELVLLGERFSAAEALQHKILNRVVPAADLVAETDKLAQKLASGPTVALGIAKRLFRTSLENNWDQQSHREAEGIREVAATDDHLEGLQAFIDKRPPKFTGR